MLNLSNLKISSFRVLTGAWVALVLFASVSFADPVVYTDATLPSANIAIGADGVEFQLSSAKTYAYTMSGSGAFYKTGAGTLTLNKNGSTFTGDVHLDGGKIKVTAAWTGEKSALGAVQAGRTINVNSSTELIFNNQNIFNNAHNDNPVALVVDGGKISNEGAYYNFLQYVTLKNGGNIHAANGNTTWEAYKLQNLSVLRNSDGSAASATTITGANNDHAVFSFGAKSSDVATSPSTIYVEDITGNANSDLVISAKIVNATTVNTGVKTAGDIFKTGTGTLELKNINNSYSGNLTIKEGTVKVTAGSNEDNRTASALGASNVEGRTVTINSGAVLELAAQDVMCDTHADTKLLFVVDGGKITNSGANFNFIQNVTLKNGANMHAANGNTSWEAYKIQNLRVERSGDAAASAVSLTGANNDHAVFSFGAISNNITTVPVSIYVEDITSANGVSDAATDLLISAK
ncbi:MAG: autotransporter-associated beta strand repeat-containing protein, partial [Thermoguttaceae bacterium]|nr:autotransporter-associated beta strand repeat-containing protein [Thermoguttaceae bacterium]